MIGFVARETGFGSKELRAMPDGELLFWLECLNADAKERAGPR